jgi:hypothetical protein
LVQLFGQRREFVGAQTHLRTAAGHFTGSLIDLDNFFGNL